MKNNTISYWNQTAVRPHCPSLGESTETDVLIIGGGITGVTCAYCLAQKGVKPMLIEAGALCGGTTGNTTGKVTLQHGIIYSKIIGKYGLGAAMDYAGSQREAVDFVRRTVEKEAIDCQLRENTAYIYASAEGDVAAVEEEHEAAVKAGIDASLLRNPDFPVPNFIMTGFKDQVVFHPVRYVAGLAGAAQAQGAVLYDRTKAVKIENGDVKAVTCEDGSVIRARHVVQATQYPVYDGPNLFFARLYPKRTYAIAVRAERDWPDGSFINAGAPARSFRTHVENGERILIVVGEGHDTGRDSGDQTEHFENLMQYADRLAGVREVVAMWSAQDYETPDQLPYIGRLSENSTIYVAAGFRKWGLSSGSLAGSMLADLITTGGCKHEKLYSKMRPDLFSSPANALQGALSPIVELIKSKLEGTEDLKGLQPGEGRVIRFKGEKAGVYRDLNDDVTILDITCTHMGTELNFNNAEKTWDCPAHGGRYAHDGKLLEGPPKNPLKVLFRGKYGDLVGDE
ncbi:Glycine/D-amino acid oxidase [Sporobacter termitidis DSM 10068]|uniref:Glycine/D-amino acid oxidase n=1 Tax=Sporobacter termitidis DSM 10068 TaxID=1123282 RepID=A0A1M5X5R1_9FIRM|nr:FAD-dependent oxidoreductase [Sporobacter termitidis]SHH95126.1 Glycine/D-amino acid oxidase [Sporobacter termitidis DSM 10068]